MRLSEERKIERYHFEDLKTIPIVQLAQDMGLEIRTKGNQLWCQVRAEDHEPSCILHEDSNRFYDFGTHDKGDVIEFVKFVLETDLDHAQEWLGKKYGFTPKSRQNNGVDQDEMSVWDYESIGIAADLATKNFRFDTEKLSPDVLIRISDRYAMPMNELRRQYPKTYANIINQTAIPYVKDLRNDYFLGVWSLYQMVKDIGSPYLFQSQCRRGVFKSVIDNLEKAERNLVKAVKGTDLEVDDPQKYDPLEDLQKLEDGKILPALGTISKEEIEKNCEDAGCKIKWIGMDYFKYNDKYDYIKDVPHFAFLTASKKSPCKRGFVKIGIAETDFPKYVSALQEADKANAEKEALQKERASSSRAPVNEQTKENRKEPSR